MPKIHPTALVSAAAKIADDVEIGAYSVVGSGVEIGSGTIIRSHVVIEGVTKIGRNNIIFPFACIGQPPQDLKYGGEPSEIIIGDNNKIREHVTIHSGTKHGLMVTKIGNNCLLMVACHVAHDCIIGNNVILANNATLAGHVVVEDYVIIGGLSAIRQFVRIGKHAIVGGMSGVENNIIPYATIMGERAFLAGINLVGLKRRGFKREDIHSLRNFYRRLFREMAGNLTDKIGALAIEFEGQPLPLEVIDFLSKRDTLGFCRPKSQQLEGEDEGNLS